MNKVESVAKVICIMFVLWILLSWFDVMCHNSPLDGDYNYNPCNIISLIERIIE